MTDSRLFLLAGMLMILAFGANQYLARAPSLVPADAPATTFSGARALGLLQTLLQENEPHPTGSAANQRIKARIIDWLEAEGFATEVQATWGCAARYNGCAWVENILAVLPGSGADQSPFDQQYVALMAHYDSVPSAPGAGDDGAGVVAVLETARALKALGPLRNPVLLLITDGEELGLIGAEAFFKFHPLADQVGVILNVEGSGTRGPSLVLRTTLNNASFMGFYREGADYPSGASLANEVFRRMPNDTDFSVSMRNQVPGIDFAFAAERTHYHTPNDNLANLDPRTVQHHGENLLPMALRLANSDLGGFKEEHVVYQQFFGNWLQWPAAWSKWILLLAAALLAGAAWKLPGSYGQLLVASTLVPLAIVLGASALAFFCFWILGLVHGTTVPWPAQLWPYRLVLFASMLTTGLVISARVNRRMPLFVALLGAWVFWFALALAAQLTVPDAANLLLVPLLLAALLLFLAARFASGDSSKALLCLATLPAVAPLLALVLLLEQSQGYRLIVSTFLFLALVSISLGPFVRGPLVRRAQQAGGLALFIGLLAASLLPLYSAWRPQPVNIQYILDADRQEAFWQLRSSADAPDRMRAEADFSLPETRPYPWTSDSLAGLAPAPVAPLPTPELQVVSDEKLGAGRQVVLRLRSLRGARYLQLNVMADASLLRVQLGGNELEPLRPGNAADEGVARFLFYGVQDKEVEITMDFADRSEVTAYLMDITTQLPAQADGLLRSRGPLASPVHGGDEALVFQRVTF